jgi:hypothetical protein
MTRKPNLAPIWEFVTLKLLDTVLVAAAALDGVLRNLLLVVMRGLSNNKAEQIFGSHRPLYHLSPKIDIAYAFEVIDEDLYSDLPIIKDIRNKFAHREGPTDFRTPKVMELVRGFVDLGQRWVRLVRSTCAATIKMRTARQSG